MQTTEGNQVTLYPPKPFWNMFSIVGVSVVFISLSIFPLERVIRYHDDMTVLIFIFLGYTALLYFLYSRQNENYVLVTKETNLILCKKENLIKEYKLQSIKRFIAKIIRPLPGWPVYELSVEFLDGTSALLYKADQFYSRKQWNIFSEKLSKLTGKSLSKEFWGENYDGKLVLQPDTEIKSGRKHANSFLLISILPPLLGAIVFMKILNRTNFMHTGIAVLIVYISLAFIYINKFKQFSKGGEYTENKLSVFLLILSTITSQIFLYLMFCFILAGFKVPFW